MAPLKGNEPEKQGEAAPRGTEAAKEAARSVADKARDVASRVAAQAKDAGSREAGADVIRQQTEQTRAALTEKLETLELQVMEQVMERGEDAKSAVSETVETVKESVASVLGLAREIREGPGSYPLGIKEWSERGSGSRGQSATRQVAEALEKSGQYLQEKEKLGPPPLQALKARLDGAVLRFLDDAVAAAGEKLRALGGSLRAEALPPGASGTGGVAAPRRSAPADLAQLRSRLEERVLRPLPEDASQAVAALSQAGAPGAVNLDEVLRRMWEQAAQEGALDDERQRRILERTQRWVRALEHRGQDFRADADAYRRRCLAAAEQEGGYQTRFALETAFLLPDAERALRRVAHAIEGQLPAALAREGQALLCLEAGGQELASWPDADGARRFPFPRLVRVCIDSLGSYSPAVKELLADQLQSGVREGKVRLPGFERTADSTAEATYLTWRRPEVQPVAAELVPPVGKVAEPAEKFGTLADQFARDSETAVLCDLALCDAAYRDYQRLAPTGLPSPAAGGALRALVGPRAPERPGELPAALSEVESLVQLLHEMTGEPKADVAKALLERLQHFRASAPTSEEQQPLDLAGLRLAAELNLL